MNDRVKSEIPTEKTIGERIDFLEEYVVAAADKTNPDRKELFAALAIAQGTIKAAEVNQEMVGEIYSFKYADLSACLEVIREPLCKNDLAIIQLPSPGEDNENRVSLTTIITHKSGQSISSTMSMLPDKMGPQAVGSVLTYLRRYMLCAMIGVSQLDDNADAATKKPDEYDRLTPRDIDELLVKADELFGDKADYALAQMVDKVFNKTHLADVPADQLKPALKRLENTAKREAKKAKDAEKSPVADKKKPEREPGEEG